MSSWAEITPYQAQHRMELMDAFHSNVPDYFDPREVQEFEKFLEGDTKGYFVLLLDGKCKGAGGVREQKKGEARIIWLLVDRKYHGLGKGRRLMDYLEDLAHQEPSFERISLVTSQHTDGFYEKLGYETTRFEKDHWAPGLHLYEMIKKLSRE